MTYVLFQFPAGSSAQQWLLMDPTCSGFLSVIHQRGTGNTFRTTKDYCYQRSKLSQFQVGFKSNALQTFLIKSKQLFGLTFTNLKQCVQSLPKQICEISFSPSISIHLLLNMSV